VKTIGLIGGMSWQSTQEYYRLINREVQSRLGGHHSARCVLFSVDFAEIENCQREGAWDRAAAVLIRAAQSLEKAGADFLILCTNTMHRVAGEIEKSVAIPLLHIAEVTAGEIAAAGISTVGLLGTRYTMEQEFFKSRIAARGIEVIVPGEADRIAADRIIFEELCRGKVLRGSRELFGGFINRLVRRGARGIILGCTEIGLLVSQQQSKVPLFDTTRIHALRAVEEALA